MSARHRRRDGRRCDRARRRVAAAAIGTVVAPPMVLLGSPAHGVVDGPSEPSEFSTFAGHAAADGLRATLAVRDYLVVEDFVDGGGPTAQATLDSLGESSAFSSLPYPGSTAVTFPGVISTLSGKSVPTYPFVVASQHPSTPQARVKQPGYLMHAQSSESSSSAETQAGSVTTSGDEYGSFSTAIVDVIGGTITSIGEARTRLVIGAFALNGAVSRAAISRTADGRVVKTSSFEASAIHVGDLILGVTEQGLVVGPQGTGLDAAHQVSDVVTEAGVTVKFLPAVETANSVLSSGIEISMERALPNLGNARGVVNYVVGRTFAQADAVGAPAAGSPAAGTPAAVTRPSTPPAAAALPVTDAGTLPGAVAPAIEIASDPIAPAVGLVTSTSGHRDTTQFTGYPVLAALVPIAALAVGGARRRTA